MWHSLVRRNPVFNQSKLIHFNYSVSVAQNNKYSITQAKVYIGLINVNELPFANGIGVGTMLYQSQRYDKVHETFFGNL